MDGSLSGQFKGLRGKGGCGAALWQIAVHDNVNGDGSYQGTKEQEQRNKHEKPRARGRLCIKQLLFFRKYGLRNAVHPSGKNVTIQGQRELGQAGLTAHAP